MAQVSRTVAKSYLETGDVPTQAQFVDILDSIPHYDDAVVTAHSGTTWDGSFKDRTLTANLALTRTSFTKRSGAFFISQDATGSRTLTIDGTAIPLNTAPYSKTLVSFIFNDAAGIYWYSSDLNVIGADAIEGELPTLSTPSLTVGTETESTVPLTWGAVTNATGYTVQRDTNGLFPGPTTVYAGSALGYTDTGLTPGTTYYYRITATASGYINSAYGGATAVTTVYAGPTHTIEDYYIGEAGNLTAHTPEAGGAISKLWSKPGNLLLVGDGTVKLNGSSVHAMYGYGTSLAAADQIATASIRMTSMGSDVELLSILLRADPTTTNETCYEFRVINTGSQIVFNLYSYSNGTVDSLNDFPSVTTVFNDFGYHAFEASCVGSTIKIKLDGSEVLSATDTLLTGGSSQRKVGLYAYTSAASGLPTFIVSSLTAD